MFQNRLGSFLVGRKFTLFALLCFTLYLRAISKYKPPEGWGLYLEGRLAEMPTSRDLKSGDSVFH